MNFALVGYGRMGREIERVAVSRGHLRSAVFDRGRESTRGPLSASSLVGVDLAFEFTRPEAAEANLRVLVAAGVSVVCGTTGWQPSPSFERALAAAPAGVLLAPNFSLGMNLFFRLVARAAEIYGATGLHDSYVHELHHRAKQDVPSGTARRLASILIEGDPRRSRVQEGNPSGPLPGEAVQVTSTRVGSEPGIHVVGFDGEDDVVTLEHRARGRGGFARGAVLAAEWLSTRGGLHTFDEVVDEIARR